MEKTNTTVTTEVTTTKKVRAALMFDRFEIKDTKLVKVYVHSKTGAKAEYVVAANVSLPAKYAYRLKYLLHNTVLFTFNESKEICSIDLCSNVEYPTPVVTKKKVSKRTLPVFQRCLKAVATGLHQVGNWLDTKIKR